MRTLVAALAMTISVAGGVRAQDSAAPLTPGTVEAVFSAEQLDQMLAPIALYPDALVSQILMAATYPLEVVEANRWRQDSRNAALTGSELTDALQQQPWDPSVKGLVQFSQVLRMMDANLAWTESLGDAFLAQQAAVMDSIQRLRRKAQAAGALTTTPQQQIDDQNGLIGIQPANPQVIYVPYYDPTLVYGTWPYPAYPPYYFPPPPGFAFGGGVAAGIGFGIGIGIVDILWGWSQWDWPRHAVVIDVNRFNAVNVHRPPVSAPIWRHDPAHRLNVPYRGVAGGARPGAAARGFDDRRQQYRGYAPPPQIRPGVPGKAAPPRQAPAQQRPVAPAFDSATRGAQARHDAERGRISRGTPAAPPPRGGSGAARPAPRTGGAPGSGGQRRR